MEVDVGATDAIGATGEGVGLRVGAVGSLVPLVHQLLSQVEH